MDRQIIESVSRIAIHLELTLHAPPARVWQALTGELGAWWGAPYLLNDHEVIALVLEPTLGGRFYESWGLEDGGLWGTVTAMKTNQWLELRGQMGMSAPVTAIVCYELEAFDGGTLLKFSHVAVGPVNEATRASFEAGWKDLLGDRLRAWVEDGVKKGIEGASARAAT